MAYFDLLHELATNKSLQKIREEVKPRLPPVKDAERVQEEEGLDYQEDDDNDYDQPRFKKPLRRQSKTFLELLRPFDPNLVDCHSDISCFKVLLIKHLKLFNTKPVENIIPVLDDIQKIVKALHPVMASQRGLFVDLTGIFKKFFVPLGENSKPVTSKDGPHLYEIRKRLHSDEGEVNAYLAKRSAILVAKLSDKYVESFTECEQVARHLYARAMDADAEMTKATLAGLLLAMEMTCGARKSAYLDPNVKFMTYKQYMKRIDYQGTDIKLGSFLDYEEADENDDDVGDRVLAVKNAQEIGSDFLLVQIGILKDADQNINKYLAAGDDRFVADRALVKPSIVFTAKQVVDAIKFFRKVEGITVANFVSRKVAGAAYSTREYQPLIKKYFARSYAKAISHGWEIGSHHMRKIYAAASFEIYRERILHATTRYIDRSIWSAMILGHGGSVNTSLSYANVDVSFKPVDDKVLAAPPEHILRLLMGRIGHLEESVKQLKEALQHKTLELPLHPAQQAFVRPDGSIAFIEKHIKRKFKNMKDRDDTLAALKKSLVDARVAGSAQNMGKLGVGRGTYIDWTNRVFRTKKTSTASSNMSDDEEAPPTVDRALQSGVTTTVELPSGTHVIANPNPKQVAGTKKQQLKRAYEAYGEDNVIENADDCEDGQVSKKKFKTNKGQERELLVCEENR